MIDNNVFISQKVLPYVYIGTHKQTKQFYIGVRYGKTRYLKFNKPSQLDLGYSYFTSSPIVAKLGFENFDWVIFAEFFDGKSAVEFEEILIKEYWKNPLLLNKNCAGAKFNVKGSPFEGKTEEQILVLKSQFASRTGSKLSEKQKRAISKANTNKIVSQETRNKLSIAATGRITSEEAKNKISIAKKGKPLSEEHKQAISDGGKGRPYKPRIKNCLCPYCNNYFDKTNYSRWHGENCKLNF